MAELPTCPRCGSELPARAPQGLCPRCLLRAGLDSEALSLSNAGEVGATILTGPHSVLEALTATVGPVPRVLLRETDPGTEPAVARPSSPEMPAPEDRSARLRLLGEIARGGMGAVLKGRDEDLGRDLAVKVLLEAHRDNPDLVRRFVEEAQIGGQLQHPGIVPIYELGTFADRRPYFAMKLVKGQTLADLLAGRPSPSEGLPRFLGIFEQVCQTVAYAHARGVIHRDLKPSNVMVGSFGEVQVMDWGLAKVLQKGGVTDDATAGRILDATVIATARSGEADTDLSRAGSVMGTPSYMAPEQARGETGTIDERADVFALGSILCEVLTGAPAFTGRNSGEIQRKAALGDTADAMARLEVCVADSELAALAKDCLAREPVDRPRDARAVADRMTAYLVGVQERLHASERERAVAEARAIEERRKRKWQLGLAASIAVFLLAGAAGMAAFATVVRSKNQALAKANVDLAKQRERAEDREQQAIDAVKRFRDAVADEPTLKNSPELEPLRKKLLKEPLAFFHNLRQQLQADQDTRPEALKRLASAVFQLGSLTVEIGNKQDALRSYQESLVIRERLARENPTVTAFQRDLFMSHNNIGVLLRDTGKPAEAQAAWEQARAISERLARENPAVTQFQRDLAGSHNNIGTLLNARGKSAKALAAFEQARAILERLARENPTVTDYQGDLARIHHNIGNLLRDTGKMAEALTAHDQARALQERLARENPAVTQFQSDLAASHHNIGLLFRDSGQPAEAMAAYREARAIFERLARENPTVTEFQSNLAKSDNNFGNLLSDTGNLAEAMRAYQDALAIQERLAQENPTVTEFRSDLAKSHGNIGELLKANGQPVEALAAFERARTIFERLARDHPESPDCASDLGGTLNNLATIDLGAGRFAEACDRLNEAIAWQRKALAAYPQNPTYREFLRNQFTNILLAARGLHDDALAAEAQQGLAELAASDPQLQALDTRLSDVLGGSNPADNAERLSLAQRAYDTKKYATAARLCDDALKHDPKLVEDRQVQHRYNAACAAALAATGTGQDDPKPDEAAKVKLRDQALGWLKSELGAWSKVLDSDDQKARAAVGEALRYWQQDPDLAGVRDGAALAQLPDAELADWKALWEEVGRLLDKSKAAP
jgi:eukaryotic-like serine/threonine-protein kinase